MSPLRTVWAAALLIVQILPAQAEDDFYKGKTINFVIATATGGGYNTYSRRSRSR